MSLSIFFTTIYLLVAFFAATLTYFEQQESGGRSAVLRFLGFFACACWPVTFVLVAITMQIRAS